LATGRNLLALTAIARGGGVSRAAKFLDDVAAAHRTETLKSFGGMAIAGELTKLSTRKTMPTRFDVRRHALAALAASTIVLSALPAGAQDAERFFSGRELTMLATSAPGGGYDWYARAVGRYMSKYIPGNPVIVVRNMVGAGGLIATNHLYNVAPKDGSTMAILDRSALTVPLLYGDDSKARFDPTKFTWLGSAGRERGMGVISTKAPATTLEEMRKTQVIFGAIGTESDDGLYGRLFNNLYGTKFKIIPGYPGQRDMVMAVEKGELDGLFFTGWSGANSAYVKDRMAKGEMRLFVQMSSSKDPDYPDVPGVMDFVKNPDDQLIVQMLLSRLDLGRPFVAPPDVPADRLAILQAAFRSTMENSEFIAEAKKQSLEVSPIYPAEAHDMIAKLYLAPDPVVARIRSLVKAGDK
jgi:tripartite-type tricarboxylate transporter receptor subunit TctC